MRYPDSPTAELVGLFVGVFLLQRVVGLVGAGPTWFALVAPVAHPWTLVTSVYAHADLGHLVANVLALALVGFALERSTTRLRFHGFVLATGMLAGIAEFAVGGLVGSPTAVLGASGAILALYGYVLAANPLSEGLLARVQFGGRATVAVVAAATVLVTVLTAGPGVALVAHVAGFTLGLAAGRAHVLRVPGPR